MRSRAGGPVKRGVMPSFPIRPRAGTARGAILPAAMRVLAALTALALVPVLSACGDEEPGVTEPAREGLAIPVDGVQYNVFITRQINPEIQPDQDLYQGPPPETGSTFYGLFIQACNDTDETHEAIDEFTVKDAQDEEFEQIELPEENVFAYRARTLDPGECIPEAGSVNQLGQSGGALLMFEIPLAATENRPLELELHGQEETKVIELDL